MVNEVLSGEKQVPNRPNYSVGSDAEFPSLSARFSPQTREKSAITGAANQVDVVRALGIEIAGLNCHSERRCLRVSCVASRSNTSVLSSRPAFSWRRTGALNGQLIPTSPLTETPSRLQRATKTNSPKVTSMASASIRPRTTSRRVPCSSSISEQAKFS